MRRNPSVRWNQRTELSLKIIGGQFHLVLRSLRSETFLCYLIYDSSIVNAQKKEPKLGCPLEYDFFHKPVFHIVGVWNIVIWGQIHLSEVYTNRLAYDGQLQNAIQQQFKYGPTSRGWCIPEAASCTLARGFSNNTKDKAPQSNKEALLVVRSASCLLCRTRSFLEHVKVFTSRIPG